jgi:hypothetical protein
MLKRMGLLLVMIFIASSALAWDAGCAAEYDEETCKQMGEDGTGGNPTTGGTCPYYMCGNAFPRTQSSVAWCDATQEKSDCPIEYCEYRPCIGFNCYPTWEVCTACESRAGNRVHVTECPRT